MIKYIEVSISTGCTTLLLKNDVGYSLKKSDGHVNIKSNILFEHSTGKIVIPATLWLVDLMADPSHDLDNNLSAAKGLKSFFQFMHDSGMKWNEFPQTKLQRPTYAYKRFLMSKVKLGEYSYSTGNLWLGVVKRFYLWMFENKFLNPDEIHSPFTINSRRLTRQGVDGACMFDVSTSDLKLPKKLKGVSDSLRKERGLRTLSPLSESSRTLMKKGMELFNKPHFTLCSQLSMLSGLREEESLTMPLNEFLGEVAKDRLLLKATVIINIGSHNSVHTKNNTPRDIEIPFALYEHLCAYSSSEKRQKLLSKQGAESPRLFVSNRGKPFGLDELTKRMSELRKLIKKWFGDELDHKYHDLRATYATEYGSRLLNSGMAFNDVFAEIKSRLGHKQDKDTLKYMQIIESKNTRKKTAFEIEKYAQEVLS